MRKRPSSSPYSLDSALAEVTSAGRDVLKMTRAYLPPTGSTLSLVLWVILGVNTLSWLSPSLVSCRAESIANGELWRLALAPWVLPRSGSLWPLLLLLLISYQASGLSSGRLLSARPFWRAGVAWLGLTLLNTIFTGVIWPIVMSGAMWCWFGEPLRRLSPRSKSKLQTGLLYATLAGVACGGLYLTIISGKGDRLMGDHIFIRPLLCAWGYRIGPHAVPLLNVRGNHLKWVVLAFCLFELLLMPSATTFAGLTATLALVVWWESPRSILSQLTAKLG